MIDENKLRLFGEALEPCDQSLLVGVAADTRKRSDLGLDLDLLVEELYFLCTVVQCAAERSDRLVADEQDKTLRTPQIVLKVVAYAARHRTCRMQRL